jgi:predicted dehydrogenase
LVKYKNGALGVIEAATSLSEGSDTIFEIHGAQGNISFGGQLLYKWQNINNSPMPCVTDSMGAKTAAGRKRTVTAYWLRIWPNAY